MRKGGVTDSDLLRYILGQKPQAHGTYDVFPDEDILEAYHKADPYLMVLPRESHSLVADA